MILGLTGVILLGAGFFLLTQTNQTQAPLADQIQETQTDEPIPAEETASEEVVVNLIQSGFTPETITIKAGTKVVFTNNTNGIATVDSNFHPTHRLYPFLNKGNFGPGERHEVVFEDPGTYTYHNHINSAQTGTVIVE